MVRMRCGIVDDEEPASARAKLRAAIEEHIPDAEERRWAEPRLAHLLGLEEGAPGDQENLFSAWRILFERLADQSPTVLVFEDMQWADAGLLDFLEYLLDWSRSHPLFVLVLTRPELIDKRPSWGLGKTFTKPGIVALSRLPEAELEPLLTSLLRKEVLAIQADPRSPERGQYAFLQDIVKRVAYETVSKRERKAKHLAAAEFLASVWSAEEDEIVEVVAAHYLDAYNSAPEDPDAVELRSKAFEMRVRAAERAA